MSKKYVFKIREESMVIIKLYVRCRQNKNNRGNAKWTVGY